MDNQDQTRLYRLVDCHTGRAVYVGEYESDAACAVRLREMERLLGLVLYVDCGDYTINPAY